MATIEVSTHLNASPERVRQELKTSRLLEYVNEGLLSFQAEEASSLPEVWEEGRFRVRLKLFGWLPIGYQDIGIEQPSESDQWVVRDNGSGSIARVWDHLIFVEPDGEGTQYTDRIQVEAGLLTPFVALFAHIQYRYRQRRWRRLVARNFAYGE
ncbi:MAG: hypothetical protein AAFY29_02050 [Pseudomonadota bacterium]